MKKIFALLFLSTLLIISCGKTSDKDYYESAQNKMTEKEYASALIDFQKIVDEFPQSEHFKFALLQTGELNHGYVNKEISREVSLEKAIKSYSLYQKKYPNDEKAPQTLFMVGFIQANELGKFEAAKRTYARFLERYPESEMIESAKSEIENLGLDPDEILDKQVQNN